MTEAARYPRTEVARQKAAARFGRADIPASLAGMFAALGLLTFVGALITAGANQLAYQLNLLDLEGQPLEVEIAGTVVALVVVFLVFLFGGWVAGRMARFDGAMNGMGAGLWLLFLAGVFALLGALVGPEYNAFGPAGLPDWFSALRPDVRTTGAILVVVLAIVAVLGGGYIGGRLGENFNRRVDATVVQAATSEQPLRKEY